MKKYLISALILSSFVFINHSFAQAGKVTPFKWYKGVDIIDLVDACPIEDIDPSQPRPSVTNITGALKVIRTDGKEEFYDNKRGQLKNNSINLKAGDQIQTYEGSSIINFSDGSSMTLDSRTSIVYGEMESLIKVKLLIGRLRIFSPSNLSKGLKRKVGAKLESKNRVAAACVRGTDFVTEQTEDINTGKYYLYEGTLDIVTLSGELKQLNAGDIATINSDGEAVLEKLEQDKWAQLIGEMSSIETAEQATQIDDTEQDTNLNFLNKGVSVTIILLSILGAGLFIYRKRSQEIFG